MTRAIEWFRDWFIPTKHGYVRDADFPLVLVVWPAQLFVGLAMIAGVIFLTALAFLPLYYLVEYIRATG